tara:strand:- start:16 stop:1020 length:1005 start_codon:yes stop_codon:yes gene_type:complete
MIKSSNSNNNITTPDKLEEDHLNEHNLRPISFKDFVGQGKEIEKLKVYIEAANKRGESLDHVILYGPPGLGKTTLANIISKELDVNIKMTSGPILVRAGDLAGVLTNLDDRSALFIDEIHRINSVVEEYLYSAMEDYVIDIMLDQGPNARSVQLNLNPFTLIGATTKLGNLTSPMRDRFGVVIRLDFYNNKELSKIVQRSAKLLDIEIDQQGCQQIASRSRGTPRIANRILKRTRDFADVKSDGTITESIVNEALNALGIDELGLDEMDINILKALIFNFNGGPVGLDSLGVVVSENPKTIEEVYEPFLIKEGFIQRTSRGRIALPKAIKYLEN